MHLKVTNACGYNLHIIIHVARMLPVCIRVYSYATRMYSCCVLVTITSSLRVDDFLDSSRDHFLLKTMSLPWIKAAHSSVEASEKTATDGTKGTDQEGMPFTDDKLFRQNISSSQASSLTQTNEFQERRELITKCKYLMII